MKRHIVVYPAVRILLLSPFVLLGLATQQAHGQTALDLRTQSNNMDFSAARMTDRGVAPDRFTGVAPWLILRLGWCFVIPVVFGRKGR